MRIALIHDYFVTWGGAEEVLLEFTKIYPQADIFTTIDLLNIKKRFPQHKITTSFLQKWPLIHKLWRFYIPLMPLAVEQFDLQNYDLVISDTASFAKGVITSPHTLHLSYIHTPPRFLWGLPNSSQDKFKNKLVRFVFLILNHFLRKWDYVAAYRPDHLICNSQTVQLRIKKVYQRSAQVINPAINIQKIKKIMSKPCLLPKTVTKPYFLVLSRLEKYKNIQTVIKAWQDKSLSKYQLIIAGDGSYESKLRQLARGNKQIVFLGRVDNKQKWTLYNEATAFLNPQEEDFGITMLESLAVGTPVIAWHRGGAKEIITQSTGMFYENNTVLSIQKAIKRYLKRRKPFDKDLCIERATLFDQAIFRRKILAITKPHQLFRKQVYN